MPYKSEKQRRYLHAKKPELAKEWDEKYGKRMVGRRGVYSKTRMKTSGRRRPL